MPGSATSRALLSLQLLLNLRLKKSNSLSVTDQERVSAVLEDLRTVKKVAENPDVILGKIFGEKYLSFSPCGHERI